MHPEDQDAARALRAGASGYVTKGSPPDTIVSAVERVMKGGTHGSPRALAELRAAGLRHAVQPECLVTAKPGYARDDDDTAFAAFGHARYHKTGEPQDAAQIHRHRSIPVDIASAGNRTHMRRNPGITDQDVDSSVQIEGGAHQVLELQSVRDVTGNSRYRMAAAPHPGSESLATFQS